MAQSARVIKILRIYGNTKLWLIQDAIEKKFNNFLLAGIWNFVITSISAMYRLGSNKTVIIGGGNWIARGNHLSNSCHWQLPHKVLSLI